MKYDEFKDIALSLAIKKDLYLFGNDVYLENLFNEFLESSKDVTEWVDEKLVQDFVSLGKKTKMAV